MVTLKRLLPAPIFEDYGAILSTAVGHVIARPFQVALIWEIHSDQRRLVPFSALSKVSSRSALWAGLSVSLPHTILSGALSGWIFHMLSVWSSSSTEKHQKEDLQTLVNNLDRAKIHRVFRSTMRRTFNKIVADTLAHIILLPLETLAVRLALSNFGQDLTIPNNFLDIVNQIKEEGLFRGVSVILTTQAVAFGVLAASYVVFSLIIEFAVPEIDQDSDERAKLLAFLSSPASRAVPSAIDVEEEMDQDDADDEDEVVIHGDRMSREEFFDALAAISQQAEALEEEDSIDENGNPRIVDVSE